jgi:NACalpha-BTF3-like transcription factor
LIFTSAGIETKFLPESELPGFAKPEVAEVADEDDEIKKALEESKKAVSFPEEIIRNLMKLGASREDVVAALTESNGDQNMAQVKLLAKLLQSPKK